MKKACALTEIFCFSDYQAPKNGSIKTNMILHEFWGVRVSSKHLRGCEPLCNTITSPLVTFSPYRVETGETLSRHAKPVLFHFSFKECSNFLQLWQKLTIFLRKPRNLQTITLHVTSQTLSEGIRLMAVLLSAEWTISFQEDTNTN